MRDVSYVAHSDELYHKAGFKYIKKYYKNGKPVYIYADENRHTQLGVMQKASDDASSRASLASKRLDAARGERDRLEDKAVRMRGMVRSEEQEKLYDTANRAKEYANNKALELNAANINARKTNEAYESELSKNTISAEAKRITDSVKSKTKSLLDKIKSSGSSTISSVKSGASNLLNKGKSALSKMFGTKTKQTMTSGVSVVTTRDASGNVIDKSYYNNPVAMIRNDDRGGLSTFGRKAGLTVGEPPSSIPQNPSDAARTRISQRNTFAKRAARTGPTEPERNVSKEYREELAYNTTGAGSSRAATTSKERTVEEVRELYRQGKVSKEYLDEFEDNSRKNRW